MSGSCGPLVQALAQALAAQLDAVRVVDQAVEDGVGQGGIADHVVPAIHRQLAGDQGGAAPVALLDDVEQIAPLLGPERFEAPVVEHEQLDPAESAHEPGVAAVAPPEREIGEQPRQALIEHRVVVATGLVGERAGQPGLAGPGRTSVILPGVRRLRFGSRIRSTPAAARSSPWSAPSVTPAPIISSSANPTGPWRSCRFG